MRFSTIFLSASMAAVSVMAQSSSETTLSSISEALSTATSSLAVSTTYSLTPAQSSQASCLQQCPAADPACRAECIIVPEGDYAQQNRTVDCIAECPQGNGTAAENLAFENCNKACLASATVTPAATAAPTTTGTGAGAAGTGTNSRSGTAQGTGSATESSSGSDNSATSSGAAPAASATGNAANNLHMGASVMGVFGLGALMMGL